MAEIQDQVRDHLKEAAMFMEQGKKDGGYESLAHYSLASIACSLMALAKLEVMNQAAGPRSLFGQVFGDRR